MSIEALIITGLVVISIMLIIVYLIPSGKKKKTKKKRVADDPQADHSQCLDKQKRLEGHIQNLNTTINKYQKSEKERDKAIMVERVKVKKLEEKLTQERQWHEKEQGSIDKKGREYREIKEELARVQEQFSKAHSGNLRFEKQVKDLNNEIDALNAKRRKNEEEIAALNAQVKSDRQEISQLKKENIQLNKKKEDTSWVTKTEYERVTGLLQEKEKELQRITREEGK